MKSKLILAVAGAVALSGLTAYAHHSFTATYQEDEILTIEGTLVQFMYRNPHSFVHVMAPDENGTMQRWGVEWGGAGQLGAQGVQRDSLRAGDHVVVTGPPSRNRRDHRMLLRYLERPSDGFTYGRDPNQTFD